VSFRGRRWIAVGLLLMGGCAAGSTPVAVGQEEISRKVKDKVAPEYPELARRMKITGVVKIQITVAPNGTVKNIKLVGGHPILANVAMETIKKWRYEPASVETTGIVEFRFEPNP
jgi:TonB family protein